MISLPAEYEKTMRALLQGEYDEYLASFERPCWQGVRVNTVKLSPEEFEERRGRRYEPVPWCPSGFYLQEELRELSKHPDYYAGLYYLQEPSAMAPAAILPVEPGDRVLDLCAAPGGKSTQLSARLKGEGLLVSNDISPSRAKALLKNLELAGADRAVVLSEAPYRLAARFPEYFDKVLVDAPCSGEGMFHKEPAIMKNWEQYGNEYYARLQREILPEAVKMLAPGGRLVYSTCTFSPMEDEQTVEWLLEQCPELSLEPIARTPGMDGGHPEWSCSGRKDLEYCVRFWPHRVRGQGHFAALFRKAGEPPRRDQETEENQAPALFEAWCREELEHFPGNISSKKGEYRVWGEKLYYSCLPEERLQGLRVLRSGLLLGELCRDRFEPSQAWAMTLKKDDVRHSLDLPLEDERLLRYLKGETLSAGDARGWILVLDQGYPLGWAKGSGAILKNKYLKAWKMNG